jgi:hypothetical protein
MVAPNRDVDLHPVLLISPSTQRVKDCISSVQYFKRLQPSYCSIALTEEITGTARLIRYYLLSQSTSVNLRLRMEFIKNLVMVKPLYGGS